MLTVQHDDVDTTSDEGVDALAAPAFPMLKKNAAMEAFTALVADYGLQMARHAPLQWQMPCPIHLGPAHAPVHAVKIEQHGELVWVHPADRGCSCKAWDIINRLGSNDWRVAPAGMTPQPPQPARIPTNPTELFYAVLNALQRRGRPIQIDEERDARFESECPVNGCSAVLEVAIIRDDDVPAWLMTACDRDHGDSQIHKALGILSPHVLAADYGAANWDEDLAMHEETGPQWAIEPLIERGQFGSIYGPREVGKSLLALDYACRLAAADPRNRVLYLDHENPRDEITKRVRAMDYTAAALHALTYAHFPPVRALDTEAGAAAFIALVEQVRAKVVILDTWSKFIDGEEASPTTHTRAYNLAIVPVRRQGVTVLALDHSGKDINRGPRGGSSKGDNVDVEWLLTGMTGDRLRLERKKSRTGRGPDLVELARHTDPLRHEQLERAGATLSPEVRACVAKLDELEVPAGWARRKAAEVLRANDFSVRNETLSAALKVRRERGGATAASLEATLAMLDRSQDAGDQRGPLDEEVPGPSGDQETG